MLLPAFIHTTATHVELMDHMNLTALKTYK